MFLNVFGYLVVSYICLIVNALMFAKLWNMFTAHTNLPKIDILLSAGVLLLLCLVQNYMSSDGVNGLASEKSFEAIKTKVTVHLVFPFFVLCFGFFIKRLICFFEK